MKQIRMFDGEAYKLDGYGSKSVLNKYKRKLLKNWKCRIIKRSAGGYCLYKRRK